MAEGEGFEPPTPCGIPVFKTGALNQTRPPLRFSSRGPDPLKPAHVRSERRRDRHGPIGFLVVFHNRDQRATHGEPRAVERVAEAGPSTARRLIADLRASRLEGAAVRAGGDLAVPALPRQPDLDIVALRRLEAHVAGAVEHDAIRDFETLEHFFGV